MWLRLGSPLEINGVNFKLNYIKGNRLSFDLVDSDVEIRELEGQILTGVKVEETNPESRAARRRKERGATGE